MLQGYQLSLFWSDSQAFTSNLKLSLCPASSQARERERERGRRRDGEREGGREREKEREMYTGAQFCSAQQKPAGT